MENGKIKETLNYMYYTNKNQGYPSNRRENSQFYVFCHFFPIKTLSIPGYALIEREKDRLYLTQVKLLQEMDRYCYNTKIRIPMLHVNLTKLAYISDYTFKGTTPRYSSFMPNFTCVMFRKLGKPSSYCLFATEKAQNGQTEQVKWSLTAHKTIINKRSLKKIDHLFQALTSYNNNNKEIYLKLSASSKNQLMLTFFKQHIKIVQTHLLDFKKLENRHKIHKSFILALNLVLGISENYTKFLLNLDKTTTLERKYVKKELKSLNDQYNKLRTTLITRKRYKSLKEK